MLFDVIFKFLGKILFFTGKLAPSNNFEKKLSSKDEKMYFDRLYDAKILGKTDTQAEEMLVKHNLRLVAHIANKYKSNYSSADDLISVGSIGLIKAVRSYDPSKASNFSTYASRCIENEILMLFRSEKRLTGEVSLDTSIGTDKDGNDLCLSDILADTSINLENQTEKKLAIEKIERLCLEILDKRELFVMTYRFGLFGKIPKTQKEIARKLNISRSYISRIEKSALTKLKERL